MSQNTQDNTVTSASMEEDTLVLVIHQTKPNGKTRSKLTLEYPDMANWEANAVQLGFVSALTDVAKQFADAKAAAGGK
jgi:hypothetical protein